MKRHRWIFILLLFLSTPVTNRAQDAESSRYPPRHLPSYGPSMECTHESAGCVHPALRSREEIAFYYVALRAFPCLRFSSAWNKVSFCCLCIYRTGEERNSCQAMMKGCRKAGKSPAILASLRVI